MNIRRKFRVYDIVEDRIIPFNAPKGKRFSYSSNGELLAPDGTTCDQMYVIQWWTGITDESGREIYSGDRISFTYPDGDKVVYLVEDTGVEFLAREEGTGQAHQVSPIYNYKIED